MQRTILGFGLLVAACALLSMTATGCSVEIANASLCEAGETRECSCTSGQSGDQSCQSNELWGECVCGGVGGDDDTSAGGGDSGSGGDDSDGTGGGPDDDGSTGGGDKCVPGTTCDDGDGCTVNDFCNADGECSGTPEDCEDGRSCTKDACVDGECLHDDGDCECDGDSDCDDELLCTKDTCDFPSGACSHDVDTSLGCNDDNPCTSEDSCQDDGSCGGVDKPCDDGVECTTDSCDTATGGCVFDGSTCPCLVDADCDNGNPCTTGYCDTGSGECTQLVDISAECSDDEPCTDEDTCQVNGTCVGTPVECDDLNACTIDSCDGASGECLFEGDETAGCNDSDACTSGDHCTADGDCTGEAKSCDDGKECSVDSCDSLTGHCTNDNSTCACESDAECDDGNPCTDDSCDAEAATCVSITDTGNVCSDGDPCTTDDGCQLSGACGGAAKSCDDGKACSVDSCDGSTGQCAFDTALCGCESDDDCDDGNVCTVNTCDTSSGTCVKDSAAGEVCDDGDACTSDDLCDGDGACGGALVTCDDDKACTADACDPASGECVYDDGDCGCTDDLECGDDNPCTDDSCDTSEGECVNTVNLSNSCSDSDPCTVGDACGAEGTCAGAPKSCNDGKDCSVDSCVPETGECSFDKADCACEFDAECDDGKACTTDTCDVDAGACVNSVDVTNECSDGNPCTDADACSAAGGCSGTPVVCDDDNPCTNDVCSPVSGNCDHTLALANECSDGNPCTENDACSLGGGCAGEAVACDDQNPCTDDACDGDSGLCASNIDPTNGCSDGDLCTVNDSCQGDGSCQGDAKVCNDDNPCTADACSIVDGSCSSAPTPGTPCVDGDNCTVDDVCSGSGVCGGDAVVCNDANPCTDDACDPADGGCVATVNPSNPCTDGDPCTVGDACGEGGDCAGAAKVCNDQNPCTTDSCDGSTGACGTTVIEGGECTDGDPCTIGDSCSVSGQCQGTDKDCADSSECSADGCNAVNGACTHDFGACGCTGNAECDDGNECTTDVCDVNAGTCSNEVVSGAECSDGIACTTGDACQSDGSCVGAVVSCNDANPCTDDACDETTGECVNAGNPGNVCSDGEACTVNDGCGVDGICSGSPKNCSDGKQCTSDSCRAADGICINSAIPGGSCSDGNNCTVSDACNATGACQGTPADCADGDACTDDACDPSNGDCVNTVDVNNSCDDGQACTLNDACTAAGCSGTDKVCNDNKPCTLDSCDSGTGDCVFEIQVGSDCSDDDLCTTKDACQEDGTCRGNDVECDDTNPCTDDFCAPVTGECDATFDTTNTCDDDNACTDGDSCVILGGAGTCIGLQTSCDDGNDCTNDTCNAATGCANTAAPTNPCSDGNACTVADACSGTQCQGSTPCLSFSECPDQKAGHWVFGWEGTGVTEDLSGNDQTATLVGGEPYNCGSTVWGLQFDDADDQFSVPDHADFDGDGELTAMAWVRSSTIKGQRLVGKAATGDTNGWSLRLTAANQIAFRINQATAGATFQITANEAYPDDGMTWIHVAATYDGTNARLYVNGALQADVAWGVPIQKNSLPLTIGAEADGDLNLVGVVSDVRVYKVALCETSISAIAGDGKHYSKLAGRWSFDEGSGDTASDSSQNANHATLEQPSWGAGANGSASGFASGSSVAAVKHDASLEIVNGITLAAWVRNDQGQGRVISKAIQDEVDGFELGVRTGNRAYVHFNEASSGNQFRVQEELPDFGQWHHIAGTWDGDQIRLYIDGVEVDSGPGGGLNLQPNDLDLWIGAETQTGNWQFNGGIDDVVVVDGVLCPEDIAALADSGGGGAPAITSGAVATAQLEHGDVMLRPQHSRTFVHNGVWHSVFADSDGLGIWQLQSIPGIGNQWVKAATLDNTALLSADVHYRNGKLAIAAFNAFNQIWFHYLEDVGGGAWKYPYGGATSLTPEGTPVAVTTAIDSAGRAWVVYAAGGQLWTHSDNAPYDSFNLLTLNSNVSQSDAAMVLHFESPAPMVGVFWGEQETNLYYFSSHQDGAADGNWSEPEPVGKDGTWGNINGLVSNEFHGVVLDDGTALFAIRTGFQPYEMPTVLLAIRNVNIGWIPLDDEWVVTKDPAAKPVVFANYGAQKQAVGYVDQESGVMALSRAPAAGWFDKPELLVQPMSGTSVSWTAASDRSMDHPQPAMCSDSEEPGTLYTEWVDLEALPIQ